MVHFFFRKADPDFIRTANELFQSISIKLIVAYAVLYFIWAYLIFLFRPFSETLRIGPITLAAVLTSLLALYYVKRRYLLAQTIWMVGLILSITLAIFILRVTEIALGYILLPFLAIVTMGLPVGLAIMLVVFLLVYALQIFGILLMPAGGFWVIFLGSVLTGFSGWVSTGAFYSLTQTAVFSYGQARKNMEEARDQRLELHQVQEDLLHANRELSRFSDRLRAMNQVAEEARRVKEEFVSKVSHELRTPLNMILGFCEMITQSPKIYGKKIPPMLLADITAIQRNSQHLLALVNDVLDLSQVEAGRMALSKQRYVLQDILDEAAGAVRALYVSKGLYLECDLPDHTIQIHADKTRIREVILNLLSNAGRFTEQGGVRLKSWEEEGKVIVSITDTGPGIAPQDQERIFEPFQQLENGMDRKYSGSGLGLSISKQFVEMHGGKMWLESQPGAGASFFFSLPKDDLVVLSPGSETSASRWVNPYQVYEKPLRRSKAPIPNLVPRFVLVESGDMLEKLFTRYLNDVEVVKCETTQLAIQQLKDAPAHALILNTPLHNENIANVTAELGELPFGTPLIACWVPGSDDAARQMGALHYLVKPVPRDTLLATLSDLGSRQPVRTILLVEDNSDTLQLLMRILSSCDPAYQVIRAMTGQQALNLLRERKPDVMLLDLVLPGMNGFQVMKEKGQDPSIRDIPTVILSSLDPTGTPIMSDFLSITKSGGLSANDLMTCISTLSEVLSPHSPASLPGHPAGSPG
jgi:signal transduction histidine kinase/CheY-like chemotaxis protein